MTGCGWGTAAGRATSEAVGAELAGAWAGSPIPVARLWLESAGAASEPVAAV
jgi:hypothetical protein